MTNLFTLGEPGANAALGETAIENYRWSSFLRMINEPWRIKAAAEQLSAADWSDADEDLDAIGEKLAALLHGDLSTLERADVRAATSALDDIRQRRAWATWEWGY